MFERRPQLIDCFSTRWTWFLLHKGDFRDVVCLHYGWSLPHLPSECVCGASFTVDHHFTCPHSGYPTLHHNEIRDITAQLMSEICPNMTTSPTLLPVTNEHFHCSTNAESFAHLDVRAQGFWGVHHQQAKLVFVKSSRYFKLSDYYHHIF